MTNSPDKTPRFSLSTSGSGVKRNYRLHTTSNLVEASFSLYNGWEKRSLDLEQGEQIRLVLEQRLKAGSIHCEVCTPDGSPILRLGDTPIDEKEFNATVKGKYPIRVTAENASGYYRLELLNG